MSTTKKSLEWPFLQGDPRWAETVIWDSKTVECLARKELNYSDKEAKALLSGGTTFKDQGCQLCCIAMVLEILDKKKGGWTPLEVYERAVEELYLSPPGLSLVPLYADLCVDVTSGRVQLCAKENYAPNQNEFRRQRLADVYLVNAYRALPRPQRDDFVVMLRIGTHDETVASHYLLIDPEDAGRPGSNDVNVLDPDMSQEKRDMPWTLMDAAKKFFRKKSRRKTLEKEKVRIGDIAAVYVFARWSSEKSRTLLGALAESIAGQPRVSSNRRSKDRTRP